MTALRVGPVRLVVLRRPQPEGFGPLLANLATALEVARRADASLYCVRSRLVASPAVFELRSPDAEVLSRWSLRGLLCQFASDVVVLTNVLIEATLVVAHGCARRAGRVPRLLERVLAARARWARSKETQRALDEVPGLGVFDRAVRRERQARLRRGRYAGYWGIDFMGSAVEHPISITLPSDLEARALAHADRLGLSAESRLVALHVREDTLHARRGPTPLTQVRNCDIRTYLPAIEELAGLGYTIVRLGGRPVHPLRHEGVIEVPWSLGTSSEFDLWVLGRARLLVATDSGPSQFVRLRDVPCLTTNVTLLMGRYGLRRTDLYVPQLLVDPVSGAHMPLRTAFTGEGVAAYKAAMRFGESRRGRVTAPWYFLPNSPEDILGAVRDMVPILAGQVPAASPAQSGLASRAVVTLNLTKNRQKHGSVVAQSPPCGRVAPSFAEKYF